MSTIRTVFVSTSAAIALAAAAAGAALASRPAESQSRGALAGNWAYDAPELQMKRGKNTIACTMAGARITLQQRDSVLIGSSSGGVLRCAGMAERPMTDAPVDSGVVRRGRVRFRLGPFIHNGTVSRGRVTGTFVTQDQAGTGRFRLTRR